MTPRRALRFLTVALALVIAAAGLPAGPLAFLGPARATSTQVTGEILGPSSVGVALQATFNVTATGGPAEAANGSTVGIYKYSSSFSAVNTTSASFTPTSGVLVNGSVRLTFTAPNVTEALTLFVLVNSTLDNVSSSTNLSDTIQIVQPYRFNANLLVGSAAGIATFDLTVALDGAPVGTVVIPTLTAGASYPVSFAYVPVAGLSPGWHTFSVNLAKEHGLVTFAGGLTSYSASFYVPGPPTNYTVYYLLGIVAFLAVILIYTSRFGARRRGRSKK